MFSDISIISLQTIQEYIKALDLIPIIEEGFVSYSTGKAVIPPVAEILFENPKGETHIKYGYIKGQYYFVIKIASGFYENPKMGISSSQGLMLLFHQKTGQLLSVLLDEGYLTDIRTAIASMITLKYLAPKEVDYIGIIGTGIQAHLQLKYLEQVHTCKNIIIWGRNKEKCFAYQKHFQDGPFQIKIANSISKLAEECKIIITTTPSEQPLLQEEYIQNGTHITAIGSDTPHKNELSSALLKKSDIIVSDSIVQSNTRGEIFQAREKNLLDESKIIELGNLIQNPKMGRSNKEQISIADLTGVAVQDISIATSIFHYHKQIQLK
ncbi:MAG: hypothetical protein QM536_05105 [Chitinophagaceae bacterium]|nr:hypothetical protein [Chitinophagaceae bacterium]